MKFTTEHRFPAPPERIGALMLDPDFEANVDLPDLSKPDVVEHDSDGSPHLLRLRYQYVGDLDSLARRLLAGRDLTLVQTVQLDPKSWSGTLTIEAEAEPGRLHGNATIVLEPDDTGGCVRRLSGDFTVKVPVVGSTVERKLLPGIVSRLDAEADALTARLLHDR
jgi:hypothetical protein